MTSVLFEEKKYMFFRTLNEHSAFIKWRVPTLAKEYRYE
jgi:hypothetical protein